MDMKEIAEIDVVVEHLDNDVIIDEHLRTSTAVLNDIMGSGVRGDRGKVAMCSHCGKTYKTKNTLRRHVVLKHSSDEIKCGQCEKSYTSQLSLEQHVRYMHSSHRCAVCYKLFDCVDRLEAHGEECRKMATPCAFCEKVYPSAVSLRNHVKYKHPLTKTHWCEICRRAFSSNTHLVNHKSSIHPEGATVCTCGKSFTSVSALQSHVLYKHTEVYARCHHCHKAFVSSSGLRRHLVKLHQVTDYCIAESPTPCHIQGTDTPSE